MPLTRLILRANRITSIGAEALFKVLYKMNRITNQVTDTRSMELFVCKSEEKTPLPKYLSNPNPDICPPLSTYKSHSNNAYGLKRPVKKLYPRNPFKINKPVDNSSTFVPVLVPLSSDSLSNQDSYFITNTSKIKAALLPGLSNSQSNYEQARIVAHQIHFYLK